MDFYKTILLATDLSDETQEVASRAIALRDNSKHKAIVHSIHVIEPLNFAYGGDIPMDLSKIQGDIQKQTKKKLAELSKQLDISAEHQYVVLGRPDVEIRKKAKKIHADVIVIGSHGRHGLSLILGSTANGVLHGAECDVLAVRIG